MNRKSKRNFLRLLSCALVLCLSVQLLPVQVLAAEAEEQQAQSELDAQREKVAQLESELTTLLGESLTEDDQAAGAAAPTLLSSASSASTSLSYEHYDGETLLGIFTFDSSTGTITDFENKCENPYALTIPAEFDGITVCAIGYSAFADAAYVTSVTIPEGVTSLGDKAFMNCTALCSVALGSKTSQIGGSAFYNCTQLESIDLSYVTSIGDHAFSRSGIKELHLYTQSKTGAQESRNLTLGNQFVAGCSALTKIVFHGDYSVSAVESGYAEPNKQNAPFDGCTANPEIVFDGNPTRIGRNLFRGATFVKNLDFIPESVTYYDAYAFYGSGITEATISEQIQGVSYACFMNCTSLKKLTVLCPAEALMPYSTSNVADGLSTVYPMFGNAFNGEDVSISLPQSWTEIPRGLFRKTGIQNMDFMKDMPNLQTIGAYAFADCTELTDILIPETVVEIGYNAFEDSVSKVYSLTIPAGVTSFETGSYYGEDTINTSNPVYLENWQRQFYGAGASDALREVYILNPKLELHAETLTSDDTHFSSHVFNYNGYSNEEGNQLIIHGAMGSTAEALCVASDGRYLFVALDPGGTIAVTVLAGEVDVTDQVGIVWKSSNGELQGENATLLPYAENVTFTCSVSLSGDLAANYHVPKTVTVLSTAEEQKVTIDLEPVASAIFTGTVDVADADVCVRQIHNGEVSEYETVAENGVFSVTGKDVYTEITVSAYGYYAECAVIARPEAENTLAITMRELPSTTTTIAVQVRSAEGDTSLLHDLTGITFSLTDGETDEVIPFTIQNNMLILESGSILFNHPLTLTVTSVDEALQVALPSEPLNFTLSEGAYLTLTEFGIFTLSLSEESAAGADQYVWVFRDNKPVASYAMSGAELTSGPLPAGEYLVIVVDDRIPVVTPTSFGQLSGLGLSGGAGDYYIDSFTIKDGQVTEKTDVKVKILTDAILSELFTDLFEEVKMYSTMSMPMVGQEYFLTLKYKLKETYRGGKVKTFTLTIPQGSKLMNTYTPGAADIVTPELNEVTSCVTVQTTADEGIICLAIQATQSDPNGVFRATISCEGKLAAEKELNYKLNVDNIRISAFNESVQMVQNFSLIVKAIPDSRVTLYVNGTALATSFANKAGTAEFKIDLPGAAYVGRSWELYAACFLDGETTYSESVTVTVSKDQFEPILVVNGEYTINFNDLTENSPFYVVHQDGFNYSMDDWEIYLPEGCGDRVVNGVIEIIFHYSAKGTSYSIPCYRVGESDSFRGAGYAQAHDYISLSYYLTDEYLDSIAGQGASVSTQDQTAYRNQMLAMFLEYGAPEELFTDPDGYLQELDESQNVTAQTTLTQMPEFLALSSLEQSQALEEHYVLESQRLAAESLRQSNQQLVEQFLGYSLDWDQDRDGILKQLGYTVRTLGEGELEQYQEDSRFVAMLLGTDTIYYYADQYQTITVNAAENTVTTMTLPLVATSFRTFRTFAAGNEIEMNAQTLESAANDVLTVFGQMSNGIEAEISVLEESCDNYIKHMNKYKFEHPDHAAAAMRLTVLKQFQKVIPVISNLLNVASVIEMVTELRSINRKIDALDEQFLAAEDAECANTILALRDAYDNLADTIYAQGISMVGQMGAMAAAAAAAAFSRAASVLSIVIASGTGMVADLYIGYKNDVAQSRVNNLSRQRARDCNEEEEDDESKKPVTPLLDPAGYVYEAVFSNRVEDATVITYYREGNDALVWQAQTYDQENPLYTDEYGFYQWFVPQGEWKVVATKDGYKTTDTTDIYSQDKMREGRDDISADGWHTVLPEQTEVHIPLETEEAPWFWSYDAYTDYICVEFAHYMKEETLTNAISVTMGDETYSGDELTLTWRDQEMSDHYYGRTFASELLISRADGGAWQGVITIRFSTEAENYAGTALTDAYEFELDVLGVPARLTGPAQAEVFFGDQETITVQILDENGEAMPDVWIYAKTTGVAEIAYFDNYDNMWYYVTSDYGCADENGQVEIALRGYSVGKDTLTVQISGREEVLEIPVYVSRDPAEGTMLPIVPTVTVDGTRYTGRSNSLDAVESVTAVITGMPGETLYYSVGEDSCPCTTADQVAVTDGQVILNDSGYYKFASYRDGEYSDRVHIRFTLTSSQGEHTHVFDKQVTEAKYLKSAADCEHAAEYYFSCTCGEAGTESFTYGESLSHSPGEAWEKDANYHWHICTATGCGKVVESTKAAHTPDHEGGATEQYAILCSVCGYVMEQQLAHTHVFDKQVTEARYLKSAADCEHAAEYYFSCTCGEAGTESFTYGTAQGHTYSQDWKKDTTDHWHVCSCGEKADAAAHEYGSDSVCDVCGYQKYTGGGGSVSVTYTVSIEQTENGSVSVLPAVAEAGDVVTIIVNPDKGYTLESLSVVDKNGNEIELTNKGDGEYTFKMPGGKVVVKATFMDDNTMLNFFTDVPADAYYYDAVLWAAKTAITNGTSAVTFSPNASCTRAQMATFLWRAAGSPEPASDAHPFTDVPEGAYYAKAVQWAYEAGITSGTSATTFSPNQTCTRGQMSTFLWRNAGMPATEDDVNRFIDVTADKYYAAAVQWAYEQNITNGTGATTFSPNDPCTRAQMVTFLYRCFAR